MELYPGNVGRVVKLWLAIMFAVVVTSLLYRRATPPADAVVVATSSPTGEAEATNAAAVVVASLLHQIRATPSAGALVVPSSSPPGEAAANATATAAAANAGAGDRSSRSKFAGLAELLAMAAMEDGTVIITSVNEAFARPHSLLGLFLESFRIGEGIGHLLKHLVVVAVDAEGFRHCAAVHPFCYHIRATSMDLSSASDFMTEAYVELVWTKLELQQRVLELGYNFLFTDVDIMWFRDPFRHLLAAAADADMATSCDVFSGDAGSVAGNWPNTGLYHVRSSNRTVEMLRRWRAARRRFPAGHEQTIFNRIKAELAGPPLRVRFRFADTARLSGFCQLSRAEMATSCTMHANCCVTLGNKLADLADVLDQWRNYTSQLRAPERRTKAAGSFLRWRVPARCGTPDKQASSL